MFDRIAVRYDLLNTVLSFGADASWRRQAALAAGLGPKQVALDIACGSGKLTLELRRRCPVGRVVGIDFSDGMLGVAARIRGPLWVRGDALQLPFGEGTFDAATVAFGLRNLADPERGLREMLRVVRPGGRAVVLEFVQPSRRPIGRAYRAYLRYLLPWIGGLISGEPEAYRYLSATVDAYLRPQQLVALAAGAGWEQVRIRLLTLGTVALLTAARPVKG